MNATDELRRMLDERGIRWHEAGGMTFFGASDYGTFYAASEPECGITLDPLTPAQAIAATVERETCKEVYLLMAMDIGDGREEVLGVYATESAATEAINDNQFGYALHHVRKWEVAK